MPTARYTSDNTPYYPTQPTPQPEHSYTLGGGGYGENLVPLIPEHNDSYFAPPGQQRTSPPLINTNTAYMSPLQTSPVRGPRPQADLSVRNDTDDMPPSYEVGNLATQGAWGKH